MNSLSAGEKRRLVSAMNRLIEEGKYVDIASIYGGDYRICPEEQNRCGSYNHTSSLPWLRLFMVQMEDELGEALPYWDWTIWQYGNDNEVPDLWEEIRAPLKPPLKSECGADEYGNGYGSKGYGDGYGRGERYSKGYGEGGSYKSFVTRKIDARVDVRKLKSAVDEALLVKHFDIFSSRVRELHTLVQSMVGCDMQSIEKAAYDPVFYLHNTFIDYLWAYWQELQRLRRKDDRDNHYNAPMPPFDRADFNHNEKTLKHNKDRDVVDYKSNLCYEYEDLIFDGKTPAQFLNDMYYRSRGCYLGCEHVFGKPYKNDKGYGNGNDKGYGKGRGKGKGYGYGKVNRYGHNE